MMAESPPSRGVVITPGVSQGIRRYRIFICSHVRTRNPSVIPAI
jgi:hypothetical protein